MYVQYDFTAWHTACMAVEPDHDCFLMMWLLIEVAKNAEVCRCSDSAKYCKTDQSLTVQVENELKHTAKRTQES